VLALAMQGCTAPIAPPTPRAPPTPAPAGGYAAEVTAIDIAQKRLTLKGSMGQLTVRVAPGVALHTFKPGDKVQITFGQEGSEPAITRLELRQP
jgi:Cu/Ag efflux protein CusF